MLIIRPLGTLHSTSQLSSCLPMPVMAAGVRTPGCHFIIVSLDAPKLAVTYSFTLDPGKAVQNLCLLQSVLHWSLCCSLNWEAGLCFSQGYRTHTA